MSSQPESMIACLHERIMGLVIFFTAIFLIYVSLDFPFDSRVFPLAVLSLMAVLSGSIVIGSFKLPHRSGEIASFFHNRSRFFKTFGTVVGYIILLPLLGYFTSSALFLLLLPWLIGYRNHKAMCLTATIFLAIIYLFFVYIFERPIPPEFFLRY